MTTKQERRRARLLREIKELEGLHSALSMGQYYIWQKLEELRRQLENLEAK